MATSSRGINGHNDHSISNSCRPFFSLVAGLIAVFALRCFAFGWGSGQARAETAEKALSDLRVKLSEMDEAKHDLSRR